MRSWQFLILASNLVLVLRDITVATQTIIAGPRDIAGVLGSSKRLECTVTDVSYSTDVVWKVPSSSILINQQASIPLSYVEKFSTETETVDVTKNEYKYSLVINNIQPTDNGDYQCKVVHRPNSNIVDSDTANLQVVSANSNGRPTCFANPSGELITGETVTLTCISGSSTADLVWRANGQLLPATSSTKYANSTSELSFTVSQGGQKYTCVSISQTSECSLILTVQYAPTVQITLTADKVEIGKSVSFTCNAVGNPNSFTYIWYYDGNLVSQYNRISGFQLNDNGKMLTLPDVTSVDDGVTLTCVVFNTIGEGAAEYSITTVEGRTTAEIVGAVLVCVVAYIILMILIAFTIWYCRQKKTIKEIKNKEMVRRAESARRKRQNNAVIPVQPMRMRGSTNAGYLSEVVSKDDDDEDRLRPIPRRKSETSSIGKKGSNESSMSDYIVHDMSTEDEDHEDTSYVYQVNPHFGENRKKGSYTVNRDEFEIPSLPSEPDSEDMSSIIPSTDL
ncbi:cell adhesion molecule 2-like [Anneissia japonica]|uniref:cell adhesion molecule 2-like n=1 Tax=Anneissia japonica TaxID=1529436 RepID=UPI00142589C6|nr:cell adhesion molecule 2-like [Anneissia japonica]